MRSVLTVKLLVWTEDSLLVLAVEDEKTSATVYKLLLILQTGKWKHKYVRNHARILISAESQMLFAILYTFRIPTNRIDFNAQQNLPLITLLTTFLQTDRE